MSAVRNVATQSGPHEPRTESTAPFRSGSVDFDGSSGRPVLDAALGQSTVRPFEWTSATDPPSTSDSSDEADRSTGDTARTAGSTIEVVVPVPVVGPSRAGDGGAGGGAENAVSGDDAQRSLCRAFAMQSIEKCVQWMTEMALEVHDDHGQGGSPAITLTLRGEGEDVGRHSTSVTLLSEGRGRVRLCGALLDELGEEDRLSLVTCLRARGLVALFDDRDD